MIISRFEKFTILLLSMYTLASLAFGIVIVYFSPKFAFYFPLCRFWQMSIGGLIVILDRKIKNNFFNHLMSICGTLAILTIVWILN